MEPKYKSYTNTQTAFIEQNAKNDKKIKETIRKYNEAYICRSIARMVYDALFELRDETRDDFIAICKNVGELLNINCEFAAVPREEKEVS